MKKKGVVAILDEEESGEWRGEGNDAGCEQRKRGHAGDVGWLGRGAGWVQQRGGLMEAVEMVSLAWASTT